MSPHRPGGATPAQLSPEANATDLVKTLTEREREVLSLIGLGLSMAEIAQRLSRTVKTIEWYRASLGKKLRSKNRVQLARIAIAAKLIEDPSARSRVATVSESEDRWTLIESAMNSAHAFAWHWDEGTLKFTLAGDLGGALGYSSDEMGDHTFMLSRLAVRTSLARMFRHLQDHASSAPDKRTEIVLDFHHRNGHLVHVRWRGQVVRDSKGRAAQWIGLAMLEGQSPASAATTTHARPPATRIGGFHWLADHDAFHADAIYHRLIGLPRPVAPATIQTGYLSMIDPPALMDVRQKWNQALATTTDELTLNIPRRCADGIVRRFRDELTICRDATRRATRVSAAVILLD